MKRLIIIFAIISALAILIAATTAPSASVSSVFTVKEVLSGSTTVTGQITHEFNDYISFNDGSSYYDSENVISFQAIGADSIDLQASVNTLGESIDHTGERIMAAKFKNTSGTGNVTINEPAANGYDMLGDGYSIILEPGQSFLYVADTMAEAVSASQRYIEFEGSDTCKVLILTSDL
jgi:hypothetical protein